MYYRFIFHISDIHIRLSSRFDEYELVFKNLYKVLRKYKEKLALRNDGASGIVVITGDLFHQKNELTPDCLRFCKVMLKNMSDIFPVVLIPGNHDFLMNNTEKCDTISSVLLGSNMDNIFYYKVSGVFQLHNLFLVHNSLWTLSDSRIKEADGIDPWIYAESVRNSPEYIACALKNKCIISLYHGPVDGVDGSEFFSDCISRQRFEGADLVLLGDIHKHQFLQNNMAYVGSLISQNFNETNEDHGCLIWNIARKTGSMKIIPNAFAFREIRIVFDNENNVLSSAYLNKNYVGLDQIPDILPEKCRLQIWVDRTINQDHLLLIKKWIQDHPAFSCRIRHSSGLDKGTIGGGVSDSIVLNGSTIDISDNLFDSSFKEYIDQRKFDPSTIAHPLFTELKMSLERHKRWANAPETIVHWKILEIGFSNMFGYGKENVVRFAYTHTPKVVGIFGPNSVGKSTIIDILLFVLFGKISRYATGIRIPKELINEHETSCSAYIILDTNLAKYKICKSGTKSKTIKNKGTIKVTEQLYESIDAESWKKLTGESRIKTDKTIKELLGSFEEFKMLCILFQVPEKSFKSMTATERKDLLGQLFCFDHLDAYEKKCVTEVKALESKKLQTETLICNTNIWTDSYKQRQLKSLLDLQSSIAEVQKQIQMKRNENNRILVLHQKEKSLAQWIDNIRLSLKQKVRQIKDIKRPTADILWALSPVDGPTTILPILDGSNLKVINDYRLMFDKEIAENADRIALMDIQTEYKVLHKDLDKIATTLRNKSQKVSESLKTTQRQVQNIENLDTMADHDTTLYSITAYTQLSAFRSKWPSYSAPKNVATCDQLYNSWKDRDRDTVWLNIYHTYMRQRKDQTMVLFSLLKSSLDKIRKTRAKKVAIQNEFAIHRHVSYNDDCNECRQNPFRHRKEQLVSESTVLRNDIQKQHRFLMNTNEEILDLICDLDLDVSYVHINTEEHDICSGEIIEIIDGSTFEMVLSSKCKIVSERLAIIGSFEQKYLDAVGKRIENRLRFHRQWRSAFEQIIGSCVSNRCKREKLCLLEERATQCNVLHAALKDNVAYLNDLVWRLDNLLSLYSQLEDHKQQLEQVQREILIHTTQDRADHTSIHTEEGDNSLSLDVLEKLKEDKKDELCRLQVQMETNKQNEDKVIKWKEALALTNQELRIHKDILSIVCKEGFRVFFIRKLVPAFNTSINNMVQHFIDREIRFEISDDGHMDFYSVSADNTSGFHYYGSMESLMVDIAVKITFSKFCVCPVNPIFIIDENISVLDTERLQNISVLFNFLKQHYEYILLISHIQDVKNVVDTSVVIQKRPNGQSHIHAVV